MRVSKIGLIKAGCQKQVLKSEIPYRIPEQERFRAGSLGQANQGRLYGMTIQDDCEVLL